MVSSENSAPERLSSDGRGRILLIAGSATAAVLLAVGLSVYLFSSSALPVEYEPYRDDRIMVDYPRGWEVEVEEPEPQQHVSWASVSFVPPDGDEDFREVAMAMGWYEDPLHEDARTESIEAWNGAVQERGLEDHVQEELDLADYADVPRGWDAVLFEDTYTGLDHMAEALGWEETRRFGLALQVHLVEESGTTAYWIAWYGPQSERRAYDRVIHETLDSFAPRR